MKRYFLLFHFYAFLLVPVLGFSQSPAKWNVNGNTAASGDFLGTTNSQPLLFYTNNTEMMRLNTNGSLKINDLGGRGFCFVTSDNNGLLTSHPFNSDSGFVLAGNGHFRSIAGMTGWNNSGNDIYATGNVGIGLSNPIYKLDVNGSAYINGIVYAQGLSILNNLEADTIKGFSRMEVNQNMIITSGTFNSFFVKNGDLRVQCEPDFNGNTIINAGTSGNVGIGNYAPQYKLDVNGEARFNEKIQVFRIVPLLGDSEIHFGDSSIILNPNVNTITSAPHGINKGLGFGFDATTRVFGYRSMAIGYKVIAQATAPYSIVMGTGVLNGQVLSNTIANSMMIGFNSNLPTLFVAPASGAGTVGKIGIGTTTPQTDLQIGNGIQRTNIASGNGNPYGILGYMGFNAEINSGSYMHTTGNGTINTGGIISLLADGSIRFNVLPNATGGNDLLQDPLHFNGGSQMRIYSSHVEIGNGAISSTSPYFNDVQTKLMVSGRIMCQDVIVSLIDWQDEVFDSTYHLMSIDSVNAYVRSNKHLPGVPSENKIETEGMSVAQTAQLQQAKLEEMMLYILQLNERLKALEAENEKLKAEGGK